MFHSLIQSRLIAASTGAQLLDLEELLGLPPVCTMPAEDGVNFIKATSACLNTTCKEVFDLSRLYGLQLTTVCLFDSLFHKYVVKVMKKVGHPSVTKQQRIETQDQLDFVALICLRMAMKFNEP